MKGAEREKRLESAHDFKGARAGTDSPRANSFQEEPLILKVRGTALAISVFEKARAVPLT